MFGTAWKLGFCIAKSPDDGKPARLDCPPILPRLALLMSEEGGILFGDKEIVLPYLV